MRAASRGGIAAQNGRDRSVDEDVDLGDEQLTVLHGHVQDVHHAPVPPGKVSQCNGNCPMLANTGLQFIVRQAGS